ncbi:hypothetical protein C0Q70_09355 [Pomacea canaliculata]|uniref:Uncharacterized protein n=1 Tax=Pomacea canaliculata TaxID=400727 RepID=A0A2T7P9K0_POMCA|nr:hypothetical protein C0Q70_09355 [Pomacea canaliculata]
MCRRAGASKDDNPVTIPDGYKLLLSEAPNMAAMIDVEVHTQKVNGERSVALAPSPFSLEEARGMRGPFKELVSLAPWTGRRLWGPSWRAASVTRAPKAFSSNNQSVALVSGRGTLATEATDIAASLHSANEESGD